MNLLLLLLEDKVFPEEMGLPYRPIYITASSPDAAACITVPTIARAAEISNAGRRPQRSETGDAAKAPAKQPACRVETMFAFKFAVSSAGLLYSPYFLDSTVSSCIIQTSPQDRLLERVHGEDASNNTAVHAKKHATTTGLLVISR